MGRVFQHLLLTREACQGLREAVRPFMPLEDNRESAALARRRDDLRRLARILIDSPGEMIVIAMGSYGTASRIFYPMLGSLLTYGSITEETAPGQFSLKTIKKEFRTYGFFNRTRLKRRVKQAGQNSGGI